MIMNTAIGRGWTAAVVAAILATVAALAFLGIASAASVGDLTVGSATVEPDGTVTINVTATTDDLGSYRVDVGYDGALVTATECTSGHGACSIDVIAPDTVRINGSNLAGITGDDVVLGTVTFLAGSSEGTAALILDPSSLILTDTEGEDILFATTLPVVSGAITIAAATETAAPAAPAAPTATPGAVPATGGAPGTSSATSMAWLLAAAGLVIVSVAGGGAWVMARAGRKS